MVRRIAGHSDLDREYTIAPRRDFARIANRRECS
jgi:hypothetical protein